jgi:hypothetical protein
MTCQGNRVLSWLRAIRTLACDLRHRLGGQAIKARGNPLPTDANYQFIVPADEQLTPDGLDDDSALTAAPRAMLDRHAPEA